MKKKFKDKRIKQKINIILLLVGIALILLFSILALIYFYVYGGYYGPILVLVFPRTLLDVLYIPGILFMVVLIAVFCIEIILPLGILALSIIMLSAKKKLTKLIFKYTLLKVLIIFAVNIYPAFFGYGVFVYLIFGMGP